MPLLSLGYKEKVALSCIPPLAPLKEDYCLIVSFSVERHIWQETEAQFQPTASEELKPSV